MKPLHILLLLIFTVLQSIAPLVHAHADGQQVGMSAPALALPHHHQASGVDQAQHSATEIESSTIVMADQLQRNCNIDFSPFVVTGRLVVVEPVDPILVKRISVTPLKRIAVFPYQKPHPHAPPVLQA